MILVIFSYMYEYWEVFEGFQNIFNGTGGDTIYGGYIEGFQNIEVETNNGIIDLDGLGI